jgi:alpha-glucosidase
MPSARTGRWRRTAPPRLSARRAHRRCAHYLARDPGEHFYGLGDKTGPLDLHGRRLRTAAMDALGSDPEHGDPLYKHWPFVLSRSPEGRWVGIYYDTMAACTFDLGCEHDNYHGFYRYVEIDDGDLDYYLMAGRTPAEVIAQFVALIGGTHLPPRWSLGFGQTAMGLTDAPDAQKLLEGFIDRTVSERVPVSAFHYGSGYSTRGKRRYVFTWNRDKFPDPKSVNARFHANGMHVVANIKPCLLDDHPAYGEARDRGAFVGHATGAPVVEPFWDGQGSHLDFTRPEAVRWWQEGLKAQVLDYGIDAGWNDNNEYAIQDEDAVAAGFGQPMPLHRSRPLQGLLMTRATFEAQREYRPNEPAFTVTRAGMPGIQRYAQTWSGDNTTGWRTLRWNIRTGLQMTCRHVQRGDVGGFWPVPDQAVPALGKPAA